MALNDDNIGWNRKRLFIPGIMFAGFLESGGTLTGLGTGSMIFQEVVAAAEIAGIRVNADSDEIYTFLPIPWDMDITQPMRFRVWFAHTQATADTPVFQVDYKGIGKQIAISDAKSSPDESCEFAAHTNVATANALEITDWEESASQDYLTTSDFGILLALTMHDLGSASANEITVLGLEISYALAAAPNTRRLDTKGQPVSGSTPND